MKDFALSVLVALFVGIAIGYDYASYSIKPAVIEKTRIDTVSYKSPAPVGTKEVKYVTRWLPSIPVPVVVDDELAVEKEKENDVTIIDASDSVLVRIPIETKMFMKEDEYYAEVTGFEPRLSYIEVYPKTVTQYIEVPVRKRFAFGPSVTAGVGPNGLGWMIGLSCTWNIMP